MKVELNIEGMKCEGCTNRISNVLSNIKGIKKYDISLENKKIILEVKDNKVLNKLKESIYDLGFSIVE